MLAVNIVVIYQCEATMNFANPKRVPNQKQGCLTTESFMGYFTKTMLWKFNDSCTLQIFLHRVTC